MTDKRRSTLRKILNSLSIVVGLLLLAGAAGLLIAQADFGLKQTPEHVVSVLNRVIPERRRALPEAHYGNHMPSAEVDGENFVGLLEIEQFGRVLPVASTWNEKDLNRFPAAYAGSIYDRDLILGGSNREGQFDFVDVIEIGTSVHFVDLYGRVFHYEVSMVNHADSSDTILSDGDDLTIFVKSKTTSKYAIIRCRLSNM